MTNDLGKQRSSSAGSTWAGVEVCLAKNPGHTFPLSVIQIILWVFHSFFLLSLSCVDVCENKGDRERGVFFFVFFFLPLQVYSDGSDGI